MTSVRRTAWRTVLPWTVAFFLAVLLGLVVQLRTGHDPALAAAQTQAAGATPRRQVLVRRVVVKRVVIHLPAGEDGGTVTRVASIPVTTTVPAGTPASSPAPAPAAPLTTHTSGAPAP